jgi:hypothetical protein
MSSSPKEISIKGFITAERHASPHIVKIISEILQNSMEANRLARKQRAEKTQIIVKLHFDTNAIFNSLSIIDSATHSSGITNIETKQILSLYNHIGSNDGFSEFGIGGKQSCMQLGNRILYETKTNESGGTLIWDINTILNGEKENHFDSISFNSDVLNVKLPFTTGTKVTITDLVPKFKSHSTSTYLRSREEGQNFEEDICKSFVEIEHQENVFFEFYKCGKFEESKSFKLQTLSNLKDLHEQYKLVVCNDNNVITTYVLHNNAYYQLYDEQKVHNTSMKKNDKFKSKNIFNESKKQDKKDFENEKQNDIIGYAILHLSTESKVVDKDDKELLKRFHTLMGFDTHRKVAGGSIVKTNITPLFLQWNKFSSHRTRYNRFRGAIEYDKKLDNIVQTDKCKTVSDDRSFEYSFRYTILQLTDDYFKRIKKEHKLYDTDKIINEDDKSISDEAILVKKNNVEDTSCQYELTINQHSSPSNNKDIIDNKLLQDNINVENASYELESSHLCTSQEKNILDNSKLKEESVENIEHEQEVDVFVKDENEHDNYNINSPLSNTLLSESDQFQNNNDNIDEEHIHENVVDFVDDLSVKSQEFNIDDEITNKNSSCNNTILQIIETLHRITDILSENQDIILNNLKTLNENNVNDYLTYIKLFETKLNSIVS